MRASSCCAVALALVAVSANVWAQRPKRPPAGKRGDASAPFILTRESSRSAAGQAARVRAAAGDCKAALDLFDEALRHSIDPTLRRDRGECHEKLGDVYPAIDDYRAYLTASPDAPDADAIRDRLNALLADHPQDITKAGGGGDYESEMRGGGGALTAEAKQHREETKEQPENKKLVAQDKGKPLTVLESDEKHDREARESGLRNGKGFIIGAYLYPRYFLSDYNFRFGQGVGLALRYAFSGSSTVYGEVGYMKQLGPGTASAADGLTLLVGYEVRVPLDRWADNQLFFGVGGGYEDSKNGTIGQVYRSVTGRARGGYRHVFGPTVALEFLADGGLAYTFAVDAPANSTQSSLGGMIGGQVGLVVGF